MPQGYDASAYTFEAMTGAHFGRLAVLMENAFGHHVGADYFDWKFARNPAGPAIGHVAVAPDGELAGYWGMIPEDYRFGETARRLYQACDVMTHTAHQRKGLFLRLATATCAACEAADRRFFAIGFGGPTTTPGYLRMGWTVPFEIIHHFRPRLLCLAARPFRAAPSGMLASLTPELVRLIVENGQSRRNTKLLDEPFIRWRLANPRRRYRFTATDDAYAIWHDAGGFLFLFDAWERRVGAARPVMARLDAEAERHGGKGILTFSQPGTGFAALLRRSGYLVNPLRRGPASARIPFVTWGHPDDAAMLGEPGSWQIAPFDHDSS